MCVLLNLHQKRKKEQMNKTFWQCFINENTMTDSAIYKTSGPTHQQQEEQQTHINQIPIWNRKSPFETKFLRQNSIFQPTFILCRFYLWNQIENCRNYYLFIFCFNFEFWRRISLLSVVIIMIICILNLIHRPMKHVTIVASIETLLLFYSHRIGHGHGRWP